MCFECSVLNLVGRTEYSLCCHVVEELTGFSSCVDSRSGVHSIPRGYTRRRVSVALMSLSLRSRMHTSTLRTFSPFYTLSPSRRCVVPLYSRHSPKSSSDPGIADVYRCRPLFDTLDCFPNEWWLDGHPRCALFPIFFCLLLLLGILTLNASRHTLCLMHLAHNTRCRTCLHSPFLC